MSKVCCVLDIAGSVLGWSLAAENSGPPARTLWSAAEREQHGPHRANKHGAINRLERGPVDGCQAGLPSQRRDSGRQRALLLVQEPRLRVRKLLRSHSTRHPNGRAGVTPSLVLATTLADEGSSFLDCRPLAGRAYVTSLEISGHTGISPDFSTEGHRHAAACRQLSWQKRTKYARAW